MFIFHPVVKWAGGKSKLLDEIIPRTPKFDVFVSPFFGGGAVEFTLLNRVWTRDASFLFADKNIALMNAYVQTKSLAMRYFLSELLETHTKLCGSDREQFYRLQRHRFNEAKQDLRVDPDYTWSPPDPPPGGGQHTNICKDLPLTETAAALFLYLNRAGFNGLYRENKKGQFNVPVGMKYGAIVSPNFDVFTEIWWPSVGIQHIEFMAWDWRESLRVAQEKRAEGAEVFVYLDPPYFPVSPTSSFTTYCAGAFTLSDQHELLQALVKLHDAGIKFILSNAGNEQTQAFYAPEAEQYDWNLDLVFAPRAINSKGEKRGKVPEILLFNYDPLHSPTV